MSAAAIPVDEEFRLARLRELAVLDTEAEPLFDALTRAAAVVTGKPIRLQAEALYSVDQYDVVLM